MTVAAGAKFEFFWVSRFCLSFVSFTIAQIWRGRQSWNLLTLVWLKQCHCEKSQIADMLLSAIRVLRERVPEAALQSQKLLLEQLWRKVQSADTSSVPEGLFV